MNNVLNECITVTLGGCEYTILPLPIEKDLEWRKSVGKFVGSVARTMNTTDKNELMARTAEMVAGDGMDDIINSMLMLPGWDGLDMTKCSRLELTKAVTEVYKAYYAPFVSALTELAISLV